MSMQLIHGLLWWFLALAVFVAFMYWRPLYWVRRWWERHFEGGAGQMKAKEKGR